MTHCTVSPPPEDWDGENASFWPFWCVVALGVVAIGRVIWMVASGAGVCR